MWRIDGTRPPPELPAATGERRARLAGTARPRSAGPASTYNPGRDCRRNAGGTRLILKNDRRRENRLCAGGAEKLPRAGSRRPCPDAQMRRNCRGAARMRRTRVGTAGPWSQQAIEPGATVAGVPDPGAFGCRNTAECRSKAVTGESHLGGRSPASQSTASDATSRVVGRPEVATETQMSSASS